MATAITTATKNDVVKFDPNVPVELSTRYPAGKRVAGMNGDRIMYSLADGRVMFLDPLVAEEVDKLNLQPGETFFICKKSAGRSPAGRTQYRWNVWLSPASEKARAAAEAPAIEADLRESIRIAEEARAKGTPGAGFAEARAIRLQRDAIRGGDAPAPAAELTAPAPNAAEAPASWAQMLLERTQILTDVYAKAIAYGLEQHQGRVKPDEIRSLMVTAFINLSNGKQQGGRY